MASKTKKQREAKLVNLHIVHDKSQPLSEGYKQVVWKSPFLKNYKAESVDRILIEGVAHRLGGLARMEFFNECWRVLKWQTQCELVVPHWLHMAAVSDPMAGWPPMSEMSFMFLIEQWRKNNGLLYYPLKCDFEPTFGVSLDGDIAMKAKEAQDYANKHSANAIIALRVTLLKVHRRASTG